MVKDFAQLRYSPFLLLPVTSTLIKWCSCSSDSASITRSSAYLRVLTTLPPTLKPSHSSIDLIRLSVYTANRRGQATHHCLTSCLMHIQSLSSVSQHTVAV